VTKEINYLSRDWDAIEKSIRGFAKRYYPKAAEDVSNASFSSLLYGDLAYIGDQLSFYQDYYINERFLSEATELDSILKHGKREGFVPFLGNTAVGWVSFYVEVPADPSDLGPDTSYLPLLRANSVFGTTDSVNFILVEDVSFLGAEVRAGKINPVTGTPTTYLLKSTGKVVSGEYKTASFVVGDFQPFLRLGLNSSNVAEVLSVVDSRGNEYYQVDHLSQNVVYKAVWDAQNNYNMLTLEAAPRRFVFERDVQEFFLQFGSGSEHVDYAEMIENPQACFDIYGKKYVSNFNLDPYKITHNDKFGIAPENTTLTVTYRMVSVTNINVGIGAINNVVVRDMYIKDQHLLNADNVNLVRASLTCVNEKPIVGYTIYDNNDDLKEKIIGLANSQRRAVTDSDYVMLAYHMPKKFGSIKRCSSSVSFVGDKTFINLFVVSEDAEFKLIETNDYIKENLMTWLKTRKINSDNVNIFDLNVVNLGIEYEIIVDYGYNKPSVLQNCNNTIREYYSKTLNAGVYFDITEIYKVLTSVVGVLDVSRLDIFQKTGTKYSNYDYDLDANLAQDGKKIYAQPNIIFEIKYPFSDINGVAL
jgi:hypothetical protein